jgi:hypothetical protein
MQTKQILLARPNKHLVGRVTSFFARNSYAAQELTSLDQLPHIKTENLHGIVISTSAISDIKENYASVFSAISKRFPDVPVAFTVTADKAAIHKSIKQNLLFKGMDVTLMSMAEAAVSNKISSKIVLIIHEDDLPQASSDLAAHHFFK